MLEVEVDGDTEVIVNTNVEVTAGNMNVAIIEDTNDIEVTVNRQEYVITGDEIYIPKRFEDAPTWMQNLITQVVDTSIGAQIQDLNEISQSLESMIDAMEVAKNTYELSVISSNDIDQRINTAVTTLNSAMNEADATILEVAQTRTTPEEAATITVDVISAQLGSTDAGTIGASVSELQTAIANEEEARSTSLEILTSSIEGAFDLNATAMNYLNTYVGVDNLGDPTGTGLLADVEILQKQNDGVIETISGIYDVMISPENPNLAELVITAEPYATWRAADVTGIDNRLAHIGDVYIKYADTINGAKEYIGSYKFIRTVVDNTSPYATDTEGFTWALVIDQAAQDAYEQALNAYDLADSKRRVFTSTPSGTIDEGDLWVTGTNPQVVKVYKSGQWELSDTQVDTFVDAVYTPMITSLQSQIDGKVESWFADTDPNTWLEADRVKHDGDMWYNTDTKLSYYYEASTNSWNLIEDSTAILALENAASAQASADGVVVSYYAFKQDTAPITDRLWINISGSKVLKMYNGVEWESVIVKNGDTLLAYNPTTKDTTIYVYNSGVWVTETESGMVAESEAITNLSVSLEQLNTTVYGESTVENSVNARIENGVGEVESKFAYNSTVTLNGVTHTSGFGIATTIDSENIPEGDSQFWVSANEFKVVGANQTADAQGPFTVNTTTGDITFNGEVTFNAVDAVYADTIVDNTTNNNDVFAQRLGYLNYADMVTAATNGQTIINGGYLRGELIEANSINAGQIDAYAITGKQISGGTITGAQIIGSVIKGSYIDLTTTLALTNWQSFAATKLVVSSWSYSGATITINTVVNHGLVEGSIVRIDGLVATTNTPIGNYVVDTIVDLNTFRFIAKADPVGTPTVTGASYAEKYAIPIDSTTISSWSYNGTVITCTVGSGLINSSLHIRKGNTVAISGLTSTTNAPNGEYVIIETDNTNNTFKFAVVNAPTGVASVSGSSKATSTYEKNFTYHNNGDVVVDSQGYIRLAGQQNFTVPGMVENVTLFNGVSIGPGSYHNIVVNLNKTWELYSWNSYNVNTLQRSIQNNVQFSSAASLVFKGTVDCDDTNSSGNDTINYGLYKYRILDTDIEVWIQGNNGNEQNAQQATVKLNGATTASIAGRYSEVGLDITRVIRGISVRIKVTFDINNLGMHSAFWFESTATIPAGFIITDYAITDLFRLDYIQNQLNYYSADAGNINCTYNINYSQALVN